MADDASSDALCSIETKSTPFAVALSPDARALAAGLVTGRVQCFAPLTGALVGTFRPHRESVRELLWCTDASSGSGASTSSSRLLTGSADASLAMHDLARPSEALWRHEGAHGAPVSALARLPGRSGKVVASGDDDGAVRVWDLRCAPALKAAHAFKKHSDYISALSGGGSFDGGEHTLLATSGDGTLSGFDLRKGKLEHRSDNQEDELLSLAVLKRGRKVVTGSTEGVLNIYSWGHLEDCSDRLPGHPESVSALVKVDEDRLITASSDGLLRVVSIQPNRLVGVIGEHSDFPTERLDLHAGAKLLASASHDSVVKVWDVGHLYGGEGGEGGDDANEGDSTDDEGQRRGKKRKKGGKASLASSGRRHHNRQRETAAFFSDIAD